MNNSTTGTLRPREAEDTMTLLGVSDEFRALGLTNRDVRLMSPNYFRGMKGYQAKFMDELIERSDATSIRIYCVDYIKYDCAVFWGLSNRTYETLNYVGATFRDYLRKMTLAEFLTLDITDIDDLHILNEKLNAKAPCCISYE